MQALSSAVASSSAVSVAKGFSSAVTSSSAKATAYSNSFAQLCINAAQSQDVTFVFKSVSSFSISLVFLVVTGQQAVAKTCAQAFTSYIINAGGCDQFVVVLIQSFIQITVSIASNTQVTLFG